MSEEKIIDKIRKLLNLANNANEHEAALAAARATELMLKHEIEESQLEDEGADELGDVDTEEIDKSGSIIPWKGTVATGLALSMGCYMYYGNRRPPGGYKAIRTYVIVGQESKRQTIKYMYQYLCSELVRLADLAFRREILKYRAEAKEYKASGLEIGPPPSARSWKNSFRLGAATTIYQRLRQQREQTHQEAQESGQTQALIVVAKNTEAVDLFMKEQEKTQGKIKKGARPSHSSGAGFGAGRKAGKSVALGGGGKALGQGAKQLGSGS